MNSDVGNQIYETSGGPDLGPRVLGRTGIEVSALTVGTGRWKDHPPGQGPTFADVCDVVRALASERMISTIDTSNNYGFGQSERWVRAAINAVGDPAAHLFIQTKADRERGTNDFSGRRMRQSLEESLERLKMDVLPLVFLHDPEFSSWEDVMSPGGAVETLVEARSEGIIGSLGISSGPPEFLLRFVNTGLFDAVITHNRFTLVDRSADSVIDAAARAGMGVYNAAPYGGGLLTAWPPPTSIYAYKPASQQLLDELWQIARLCDELQVRLGAAALQWSLRDPRITSTIVGLNSVADYRRTLAFARLPIPPELWQALPSAAGGDHPPLPETKESL